MTGYDSLSLGAATDCSYYGVLSNPDDNTCIFGGGCDATIPNALGDVDDVQTNVVIQGDVTFAATNTYSGTTTVIAGTLQVGDGGTTGCLGSARRHRRRHAP